MERLRRRWPLLLLTLLTMAWLIWSLVQIESSEGSVRALDSNTIAMTSGDLRGLLMAAETSRAEADALRRSLEEERSLTRGYEAKTQALVAALGAERTSWQDLENALNAELRDTRRQRMSWGITGFGVGVLAGLMVQ